MKSEAMKTVLEMSYLCLPDNLQGVGVSARLFIGVLCTEAFMELLRELAEKCGQECGDLETASAECLRNCLKKKLAG